MTSTSSLSISHAFPTPRATPRVPCDMHVPGAHWMLTRAHAHPMLWPFHVYL